MHYLIANEIHFKGKNAKRLERVKEVFEKAGISYEVLFTKERGDAKKFAERCTSDGNENTIVALGGDGTLHEIINGFCDFEKCSLGIIPVGTGNDFAEYSHIPKDEVKAAELIAYGTASPIDYIQLSSGLRSINSVGTGIDVDVLKRTYAAGSKGKGKYLRSLVSSLVHFKSSSLTVKYDGKEEKHFGLIAAIGNGGLLGGGIKLFPEAKIDDGYLDLIIVDYISKPKILGAFLKLVRGKVAKIKKVTFVKTKAATILQEEGSFTIQAEGELYDNVPIEAHVVEGKLKFYHP